jgi:hypothetical protein
MDWFLAVKFTASGDDEAIQRKGFDAIDVGEPVVILLPQPRQTIILEQVAVGREKYVIDLTSSERLAGAFQDGDFPALGFGMQIVQVGNVIRGHEAIDRDDLDQ